MDKKTSLAIIIIFGFMFFWSVVIMPKFSSPKQDMDTGVKAGPEVKTAAAAPRAGVPEKTAKVSARKGAAYKEHHLETDSLKITFSEDGGSLKHYFVKEKSGLTVDLVPDAGEGKEENLFFKTMEGSSFSFLSRKHVTVDNKGYTRMSFRRKKSAAGFEISKDYLIADSGYLHRLHIKVTNKGANAAAIPADLELSMGPGVGGGVKKAKENLRDSRAIVYKDFKTEKLKKSVTVDNDFVWAGIDNRYFMAILLASETGWKKIKIQKDKKTLPSMSFSALEGVVGPGEAVKIDVPFYYGPKSYLKLKSLGLKLEEAVDFGFFGVLGKMVIIALDFLEGITKNYGISIIILTVFLQILMYPLTAKSFKASLSMKKLQPQIKLIQEKYKGDSKRLNAEMLNIYKTSGTNPMGGCLPMLLQMPIFLAFFNSLRNAYELRHAPFILWIKDLSAPDPYFVLPVLMGLGMFVQQKMMTVSSDPTQVRMAYIMPIVLTFLFLKFPSGLVLYWLTNSIVTGTEQFFMLKRQNKTVVKKK